MAIGYRSAIDYIAREFAKPDAPRTAEIIRNARIEMVSELFEENEPKVQGDVERRVKKIEKESREG